MNNKEYRNLVYAGSIVLMLGIAASFFITKADIASVGIFFGYGAFPAPVVTAVTGGLLMYLFCHYTKKRYKELNTLNAYLDSVLAGVYELEPQINEEGELSILHNNIYKATVLLHSQNEQLKSDKRYLADVMADISHQLKTPLTSMSVMNDLLDDKLKNRRQFISENDFDDRQKNFLDIQRQQIDKMNWLVQNLLKLSKLDAGIVDLKTEELDLEDLLEESLQPFLIMMELKEIQLVKEISPSVLRADRNWTIEVFRNVIKNGIEHMDAGGVLQVKTGETSLYTYVSIKDNGSGIAQEDLPHLFERFYRGKDASPDSIGIGLALAKTIIEKERGEIRVNSTQGQGTEFEMRFYKAVI